MVAGNRIRSTILTLPPGHPYRALPLVGAAAFREALAAEHGTEEIDALFAHAREELQDPELWCTSYPLVQGHARMP